MHLNMHSINVFSQKTARARMYLLGFRDSVLRAAPWVAAFLASE